MGKNGVGGRGGGASASASAKPNFPSSSFSMRKRPTCQEEEEIERRVFLTSQHQASLDFLPLLRLLCHRDEAISGSSFHRCWHDAIGAEKSVLVRADEIETCSSVKLDRLLARGRRPWPRCTSPPSASTPIQKQPIISMSDCLQPLAPVLRGCRHLFLGQHPR